MLEKLEGVVIRTQEYGETHKLVTIFTGNAGKITALARGAKKPKSRMAAVTQPFVHGQFFIYMNSGLSTIQQGEVIESFRPIREDIIKTSYAAYLAELTNKLVDQQTPVPAIFKEFYAVLRRIAEDVEPMVPIMMYELKLYELGGFSPVINQCANCGRREDLIAFSFSEGGLLCNRCKHLDEGAVMTSPVIVKLLHLFQNVSVEQVGNISVKKENVTFLRQLLDNYYDQFGGYYLKSRKFLQNLDMFR